MTIETELPAVKVGDGMAFFTANVDRWGAAEWFDRLAKAIREQDNAVRAKDDISFEIFRSIAASSAMTLVREFEEQVRSALTLKDDPGNGDGEAERLRHIVSDCAAALVSGAFISPKASVEFMEGLPKEISLVVSGLRDRCEKAEEALQEAVRALKPLGDAVFNDNGDMTVSLTLPTTEECIAAYFAERRIAAAIRALIPGGAG